MGARRDHRRHVALARTPARVEMVVMAAIICYCGEEQTDTHVCEYGDPWGGWASTPVTRVPFVPVPDGDGDEW